MLDAGGLSLLTSAATRKRRFRGVQCRETIIPLTPAQGLARARSLGPCGPSAIAEFLSQFPKLLKSPNGGEGEEARIVLRALDLGGYGLDWL